MIIRDTKVIDYKGRVTLSSELLRLAGLKVGDEVEFTVTKSQNVLIKKYKSKEELDEEKKKEE